MKSVEIIEGKEFWVPDDERAGYNAQWAGAEVINRDDYRLAEIKEAGCDPKVIFDVGANCGAFSHHCLDLWPKVISYAFEPDPRSVECLRQNLLGHIVTEAAVVGDDRSEVVFHRLNDNPASSCVKGSGGPFWFGLDDHDDLTVAATQLSVVLERGAFAGVDILKLDCEGCEAGILEDLQATGWLERVDWIRFEWHGRDNLPRIKAALADTHEVWIDEVPPTNGHGFAKSRKRTQSQPTMKMAPELQAVLDTVPSPPSFSGRGIVTVAGGELFLINAIIMVRLLRDQGCHLPIQCWYLDKNEVIEELFAMLRQLGVEMVDASEINKQYPMKVLRGWECKAYAVAHSPFAEVMFLDADNLTYRNPEYLFDSEEYLAGDLFFHDRGTLNEASTCWEALGCDPLIEREFESGQSVVNKSRAWRALCLCNYLDEHGVENYYSHWYGDKESWHFAWHLSQTPYSMRPGSMKELPGVFQQHDASGQPLFFHHGGRKFTYENKPDIADFPHAEKVLQYWEDIRRTWTPERELVPQGERWTYYRFWEDAREVVLREDGVIVHNGNPCDTTWRKEGENIVVVGENGEVTIVLEPTTHGYLGRNLQGGKKLVCLERIE